MNVFVFVCDSDSGVLTEELAHTYHKHISPP